MRRRDLLALLLAARSSRAHAQQREKPYRLVILNLTLKAAELTETGPFRQYTAFFENCVGLATMKGGIFR